MASLNIDASLIKNSKLIQTEERIVEMQNGCICCTLREDLVTEVGKLAKSGQFDYLVIESTGIGEPMQTAETFTMQLKDTDIDTNEDNIALLSDIARLDTCVTVVDAAALLANASSVESLAQRGEAANDEDDRNVADLLIDQIEFADVILLNKTDLLPPTLLPRLQQLLHTLNPEAHVIPTLNSEVDIHNVIHTGRFSFEKAAKSAGWLQSLQDATPHTPETLEYGIGSFVYRSRRPFDPEMLYAFMNTYFFLQEPDWREAMGVDVEEEAEGPRAAYACAQRAMEATQHTCDALSKLSVYNDGKAQEEGLTVAAKAAAQAAAAAAEAVARILDQLKDRNKNNNSNGVQSATSSDHTTHTTLISEEEASQRRQGLFSSFGQVLRAKGFVWLSSRPDVCGEWSQAGGILRFTVGGPWYAALPQEAWPQDPAARRDILKDFDGEGGDRRQELVFIGIDMDQEGLTKALDACLVSDSDSVDVGVKDPFAPWPSLQQLLDAGEDDEEEEEEEGGSGCDDPTHDHNHSHHLEDIPENGTTQNETVLPPAGTVLEILHGAAEVQEVLNTLPSGSCAYIQWHADWVASSVTACHGMDQVAAANPTVIACRVNVELSQENRALAMEKVMERACAKREGAKPVLRQGRKFPVVTVHRAPSLQPAEVVSGEEGWLERVTQHMARSAATQEDPRLDERYGGGNGSRGSKMTEVVKGAAEFKTALLTAKQSNKDAIVIWSSSSLSATHGNDGHTVLHKQAAMEATGTRAASVIFIDVNASNANTILAEALKIKSFPTLHRYKGMKLENVVVAAGGCGGNVDEVLEALSRFLSASSATSTSASVTASSLGNCGPAVQKTSTTTTTTASASTSTREYDPPTGKFARPGATKPFPNGRTGHFFPKMPCLRCGSPWWSSDEWNATCLRCGWDCERQGYDDDSKPLPAYQKKWEMFVLAIKEGKTVEWSSGRDGGKNGKKTTAK